MKSTWIVCAAVLLAPLPTVQAQSPAESPWPALTQSAKPWTRWWWPGSAVERSELTTQLEKMSAAGLGGVEITPIYGARGSEARYIDFLSPRWMEMLEHTGSEAQRLGMGVDMATGTGWPFGGPGVATTDALSALALTDGVLGGAPTAMKVKRAAPGGEGLVLDPYSTAALTRYLQDFSNAFAQRPRVGLRSQFHDSFEYYNAGWTPALPAKFREMHGYDLESYAAPLMGAQPLDADTLGRIKGDYRRTLARLHLDYVNTWVEWSHAHGFLARNQAHGAPGNLLDLYAASDIPETESFGMTSLPIAGLRAAPEDVNVDPDPAANLIGRFASSAAHVMGRPLASSETLTWLRENFREPPSAAKPQLDRLFAAGINHIFFHGTVYSPADAGWPGWFFYAATQDNPNNPLWQDFAAMNAYVGRVQSVLQAGRPDNDILLYWPFDELNDDPEGLMHQYGVHGNAWLTGSSTGQLALELLAAGYSFDLVSDAQLSRINVDRGALIAPGARYSVIVVPKVRRLTPATLTQLRKLLGAGARVVFANLPEDVPGYAHLDARRAELNSLRADPVLRAAVATPDFAAGLAQLAIRRETAPAAGLSFIRRARADGHDYFLANLGAAPFDGWLQLGTSAASALLLDPLDGSAGVAAVRKGAGGNARVYLQLASGQSAIVRTLRVRPKGVAPWHYLRRESEGVPLAGTWAVEFIKGGPVLPPPAQNQNPGSWTELPGDAVKQFAGTARYRIEFDGPVQRADEWLLDLGDVRESARVRLNGREFAVAWSLPFTVRLGSALKARGNVLEIEVTNLPANRVRDLDIRKVEWKIMRDINLASLKYKALDASQWALAPSGLLGPVRLVPLKVVSLR